MPDFSSDSPVHAPAWKRTIIYHASSDALGPRTEVILSRLGYQMLLPETFRKLQEEHPSLRAELLVVDGALPIVLLTGKQGVTGDDPRIVGAAKRPAGLHDLYRLMQQVFEDYPRSTPRVATYLDATCESNSGSWKGRVLSLSENGCLIRSSEAILLGQKLRVELDLPRDGRVELVAEATYQLLPDTGLVFNALESSAREALVRYVTEAILA